MQVARTLAAAYVAICLTWVPRAFAQAGAEAAERNPAQAGRLAARALDLLRQGEDCTEPAEKLAAYTEGERLARTAVQLDDNNADAHFAVFANYGRRLLMEGVGPNPLRLLEVNQELDRCLALNPNHADALAARGGLYRQLPALLGGNLGKAKADLTRALDLNPESAGTRIELALTYRDLGDHARAEALLREAERLAVQAGRQRHVTRARELLAEVASH